MNSKDLKELWDIISEMGNALLELSCSSEKAHIMACDVYILYFGDAALSPQKEPLFISQYGEIQIKAAITSDYTHETMQIVSKLDMLNDKLKNWYDSYKNK